MIKLTNKHNRKVLYRKSLYLTYCCPEFSKIVGKNVICTPEEYFLIQLITIPLVKDATDEYHLVYIVTNPGPQGPYPKYPGRLASTTRYTIEPLEDYYVEFIYD